MPESDAAPSHAATRRTPGHATASAGTNIALVKYWGKRPGPGNVPAAGSLSLTLAELGTRTTVLFDRAEHADVITLNDHPADAAFAARTSRFLDLVRQRAGLSAAARVSTFNTVPTAAGLASSASGFAALAAAAAHAAGLTLSPAELSALARQGSGSAARSIFGGFVEMSPGHSPDGADAHARPVLSPDSWDVRLVVALTAKGPKAIGSTEAMSRTAATSPYYDAWIASVPGDLKEAHAAIAERDLGRLGQVAERSCLRMHACAMATEPGIIYWNAVTIAAMQKVLDLRAAGTPVYFTIDAGPHVKALCGAADAEHVAQELGRVPGVLQTLTARPGVGVVVGEEQR